MRQLLYNVQHGSSCISDTTARQNAMSAASRMAEASDSARPSHVTEEGQAIGGCEKQPQGLFGADEVGFQAAGSAVKAILAMRLEPGVSSYLHVSLIQHCCSDKQQRKLL